MWSDRQEEIFDLSLKIFRREVEDKHLVVNADAGTGKSTTLFEIIRRIGQEAPKTPIWMLSFNKDIQLENVQRLKKLGLEGLNVEVMTMHSLGYKILQNVKGRKKRRVDPRKVWKFVDTLGLDSADARWFGWVLEKIREQGVLATEPSTLLAALDNVELDLFAEGGKTMATVKRNIRQIAAGLKELDEDWQTIDFNDMVRLPLIEEAIPAIGDWLDVKDKRGKNAKLWWPRVLLVDECFPYGTPVMVDYDLWVPIGEIVENPKKYTHVLSYDLEQKKILKRKITSSITREASTLLEFGITNEDGTVGYFRCTEGHKLHLLGKGTVRAEDARVKDKVITYNGGPYSRGTYYKGEVIPNKEVVKHKKPYVTCGRCGVVVKKLATHMYRKHTRAGKITEEKVRRNSKAWWDSKKADKFKREQSERMLLNNPTNCKKVRKKISTKVSEAFWAKSHKERTLQVERFKAAPRHVRGSGPNKVEGAVVAEKISGLRFTGDGKLFIPIVIDGVKRMKNPDFVYVPKGKRLTKNFKPEKVVEIMDFTYWHSKEEKAPLKRAYKRVGIECLILDAKLPVDVKRQRIESFINNHTGVITSIRKVKNQFGPTKVYDLNIHGTHLFWVGTLPLDGGINRLNKKVEAKVKFPVLVHNCQDMNGLQIQIIRQIVKKCPETMVIPVGDVKQSIYFFRGAFNSLQKVQKGLRAPILPLDISYRCHQEIVKYVNENTEGSTMVAANAGGTVYELEGRTDDHYALRIALNHGLQRVVSPSNKHLISCWIWLWDNDVTASLKGTNLIPTLKQAIAQLNIFRWADFLSTLKTISGTANKTKELRSNSDVARAILTVIDAFEVGSIQGLHKALDAIHKESHMDDPQVLLDTVHSSKGQESDVVLVVNDFWPCEDLANMKYVAWTRAAKTLIVVDPYDERDDFEDDEEESDEEYEEED